MEDGKDEIWKKFLGKKIKVIVEDTNFPKKKEGILKNISNTHLFLDLGHRIDIILLKTILRIEVEGGN